VRHGAALAGAELVELEPQDGSVPSAYAGAALAVLTRVTSELDAMAPAQAEAVVAAAHRADCPVFIDDAYGTRVGPALLGQKESLAFGADLAITSCDKAGLGGPRAGLMVGDPDIVERAVACGGELGLEARGPLVLGALRALERYRPQTLRQDSATARRIARGLQAKFGADRVLDLCMGPTISEEDVLAVALAGRDDAAAAGGLVPAEASCLMGMVLLEDFGIVTSNVAERPGARASLRLRPTIEEVERFGGAEQVVAAVDTAFQRVRGLLGDAAAARVMILGAAPAGRAAATRTAG
jgi:L-seryl-tRNA(Ser) seleniumtransferase